MIDEINERLNSNLDRVKNLVTIYEAHLQRPGRGRQDAHRSDVLRATVVLLHASLEDFLRSIANWKLPSAKAEVVAAVPLLGTGSIPKKFTLGDLAQFRGMAVDDVISKSVDAYLDRSNYNNAGDLRAFFQELALPISTVEPLFSDVNEMMRRRHLIVHRADRNDAVGRGQHATHSISRTTVNRWIALVEDFCTRTSKLL